MPIVKSDQSSPFVFVIRRKQLFCCYDTPCERMHNLEMVDVKDPNAKELGREGGRERKSEREREMPTYSFVVVFW